MKKLLAIFLSVLALLGLTACANAGDGKKPDADTDINQPDDVNKDSDKNDGKKPDSENPDGNTPDETNSEILIAYFSCTNTTAQIAGFLESATEGTLYRIMPAIPYTADDLKYYTDCRADREQADPAARPAIGGKAADMDKYSIVFLGYPIWHGQAPRIISTFLESYDFSGKTVIPFCTSASSPIGSSDTALHSLAPSAEWAAGRRFSSGSSQADVQSWVDGLKLRAE